jgi:AraC-like DNA-binding protein
VIGRIDPESETGAFTPSAKWNFLIAVTLLAATALVQAGNAQTAGPKLSAQDLIHNLRNKTFTGERTDLRFENARLAEILAKFEETSGLAFNISPGIDLTGERPRAYNFLGYPWDRALDAVLTDYGFELRLRGGGLWVDHFTPESRKTRSAFFVGSVTAAALACAVLIVLAWRRRRRRAQARVQKISLDPEAVETAVQRLTYMFQVEKIYRNGRISLDSLAERLDLQPHQLSAIVNSRLGRSFTELVSDNRVEEVKKRLSDPAEKANILNIAYDAGFGTKASFNRIFKERTGLTPSEFRRKSLAAK